jgi:hypothetical protein
LGIFKFSSLNSLFFSALFSSIFEIISNLVYFIVGGEVNLVYFLESGCSYFAFGGVKSSSFFNFNLLSTIFHSSYSSTKFYISGFLGTLWSKYCISYNNNSCSGYTRYYRCSTLGLNKFFYS